MLSRNQIRIKIFHCIYSYHIKNESQQIDFQNSFQDYINLYNTTLELLIYIKKRAEFEISHGLQKKIATQSDLAPNKKFIENVALNKIQSDFSRNKNNEEEKTILAKKIFLQIKSKTYFNTYMNNKKINIEEDKRILKKIVKEDLFAHDETLFFLESQSIYWNDDFFGVQILLSNMLNEFNPNSSKSFNFKNINVFKNKEDEVFAKTLFLKTIEKKDSLTKTIHNLAKNWDSERISSIDLVLMQLAMIEITEFKSIPYKVSLNEYIEISKIYSSKKSHEFINGILDAFLKNEILT